MKDREKDWKHQTSQEPEIKELRLLESKLKGLNYIFPFCQKAKQRRIDKEIKKLGVRIDFLTQKHNLQIKDPHWKDFYD